MKIYIPTMGRPNNQITLRNIPSRYLKDTFLVIPNGEQGYEQYDNVIETPPEVFNIATTRQWLLDGNAHYDDEIMQLDDDLSFFTRIPGSVKLRKPVSNDEITPMFEQVLNSLEYYPLVSVSPRQGNNHCVDDSMLATKSTRFLGINRDMLDGERFDRTTVMDDYDFTLQLLRNGKANKVLFNYAQDQPASGSKGGASLYRTKEVLRQNAERLYSLHPDFVKVVEKETKSGWFGDGKRTDVTIQWKKAYASSKLPKMLNNEDVVGQLPWRTKDE